MRPGKPMQNHIEPIEDGFLDPPPEIKHKAALYVCDQAHDVEDATELMLMLGVMPDGER